MNFAEINFITKICILGFCFQTYYYIIIVYYTIDQNHVFDIYIYLSFCLMILCGDDSRSSL